MPVFLRVLLVLLFACVVSISAHAEQRKRALLIGVSSYTNPKIPDLLAPKNDVRLMRDSLTNFMGFKPAEITVLADGLDGATEPTKANIMREMQRLLSDSKAGDFTIIYYSGHGSFIRNTNPAADNEGDGNDELLLPIDTKSYNADLDLVENAIVDDAIGKLLDKAKGDVWMIFDACHSGGATRGGGDQTKHVAPTLLGIPQDRIGGVRIASGKTRGLATPLVERDTVQWARPEGGDGRVIAFSAVPSHLQAIERKLDERGGQNYSVFTHVLADVMARKRPQTFRQLALGIYNGIETLDPKLPLPQFEGDLDAPLPGAVNRGSRWEVIAGNQGFEILQGGTLHGIYPGTVLDLKTARGKTIGYMRVTKSSPFVSSGPGIAFNGVEKPDVAQFKEHDLSASIYKAAELGLRVALPPVYPAGSELAEEVIDALRKGADPQDRLAIEWVQPKERADVYLRVAYERIYMLPSVGHDDFEIGDEAQRLAVPNIPLEDVAKTKQRLVRNLRKALRQSLLLQLAVEQSDKAWLDQVNVELKVAKGGLLPAQARSDGEFDCDVSKIQAARENAQVVDIAKDVTLEHCDAAFVKITNLSNKAFDATVLYLDASGGISVLCCRSPRIRALDDEGSLFPVTQKAEFQLVTHISEGLAARIKKQRGARSTVSAGPQPIGKERLIVALIERERGAPNQISLNSWAQSGLEVAPPRTRGASRSKNRLVDLLTRNVFQGKTRGAQSLDLKDVGMKIVRVQTVGRSEFVEDVAEPEDETDPAEISFTEGYPANLARRLKAQRQLLESTGVTGTPKGVYSSAKTWCLNQDDAVLRVCFFGGSPGLRRFVGSVAKRWVEGRSGLRLDFGKGKGRSCRDGDRSHIRISFRRGASWSLVGMDSINPKLVGLTEPSMNLANLTKIKSTKKIRRIILHEFGHALGLEHEHQNPKGACGKAINFQAAMQVFGGAPYNWGLDQIQDNMGELTAPGRLVATDFDRKSVMMYALPKKIFQRSARRSCAVTERYKLSVTDKRLIGRLYPRSRRARRAACDRRRRQLYAAVRRANRGRTKAADDALQFYLGAEPPAAAE